MRKNVATRQWPHKRLCEIAEVVKGKKPGKFAAATSSETLPYLEAAWLRRQSDSKHIHLEDTYRLVLCDVPDILVLWDGYAGDVFFGERGIVASTMARVKPSSPELLPEYLYFFLLNAIC